MNKDNVNKSIAFSGTIIIIIFIVLCLTVMSVLSFTTANSDYRLTKKAENKTVDFYYIHGQAEEKLSDILGAIITLNNNMSSSINVDIFNKENYLIMLKSKLKDLNDVNIIDYNYFNSYFMIHYEVRGNENQKINVDLKVDYPTDNNLKYEIVSWNLLNIELPNYTDELKLWEGIDIDENY